MTQRASIGAMWRRATVLVLAVCWPLRPAQAQDVPLNEQTRLRVTADSPLTKMQAGTYRALTDTALVLFRGGSTMAVPLASITRLEVSRGRKPNVAAGIVGFLLGGAAGGLLACTANRDDYGVFCAGQDDSKLIVGAVLGAAVGAAVGALVFRRERWRTIRLDQLRP